MASKEYIAAIELGSSKVSGIIGLRTLSGIQIQAYVTIPSSDFISRGIIQNIDKTAQCLTEIVNRLEAVLPRVTIKMAYVGICGQSLRSYPVTIAHDFGEEVKISKEDVENMIAEIDKPLQDTILLDSSPMEYMINGKRQKDPIGVTCNHIEGNYLNIVVHASLPKRVTRCFEIAQINIADSTITPLTTALEVLSEEEKNIGCVLVDLGANTTSVSIFKNGLLRRLAVIPLGSHNITKDIENEQFTEEDAELLKITYGFDPVAEDEGKSYMVNDKRSVEAALLNNIIEARTEEIFANVKHQMEISGYGTQLIAGLVFTGGGSKLRNLKAIAERSFPKTEFRIANRVNTEITSLQGVDFVQDETNTALLGLLASGKDNCIEIVEIAPEEEKEAFTPNLFGEEDNIPSQTPKPAPTNKENKNKEEKKHTKKSTPKIIFKCRQLFDDLINESDD